jgi:hypothetical protein
MSSTKQNPRKASCSYLRKKHPHDPRITAEGWILDDHKSAMDSIGGVHNSILAWKDYLGISRAYKARYEGGIDATRGTDFAIFRPAHGGRRQKKYHSAAGRLGGIWYPLLVGAARYPER